MPLQKDFYHLGCKDAAVKVGAVQYDILGVKEIIMDPKMWSAIAKGDNVVLTVASGFTGELDLSFLCAVMPLALKAILTGETVVDSGVTPNMKTTYSIKAKTVFPEFSFESYTTYCQTGSAGTVPGDMHYRVGHARVVEMSPLNMKNVVDNTEFETYNVKAKAWADSSTAVIAIIETNETSAVIAL